MSEQEWDIVIDTQKGKGRASLKTIWYYRDLLWLLVRRDFVSFYKQTILGPIWIFIKPVFSSVVYLFIFGKLAGLSTDGIPPALFYISGVTVWSFFSETVFMTSSVLTNNAAIFGKVYFPRLIMPLSIVFSNVIKMGIQILMVILIYAYFLMFTDLVTLTWTIILVPVVVLVIGFQAMGLGLFVSAISTKYRDLSMFVGYFLQVGLFVTPIVYPLSSLDGYFKLLVSINPMTIPLELFRFSFFGTGSFTLIGIIYVVFITLVMTFIGIISFNRTEKTFIDTV